MNAIQVKPLRVRGACRDGDHFRARAVFHDWSVEVKGDSVHQAEARAKALEAALDKVEAMKAVLQGIANRAAEHKWNGDVKGADFGVFKAIEMEAGKAVAA